MIKLKPQVIKQDNGKYSIIGVPIFKKHNDRGFNCDDNWMRKCADVQKKWAEGGFYPKLTLGHTDGEKPEIEQPPIAGLLNNYRVVNDEILADYVDVETETMEQILNNQWPGRSVEVKPLKYEIPVVAMLKSTPPYLKLPDLIFSDKNNTLYYSDRINYMSENKNEIENLNKDKKEEANKMEDYKAEEKQVEHDDSEFKKFCSYMKKYEEMQHTEADKSALANKEKEGERKAEEAEPDGNQLYVAPETKDEVQKLSDNDLKVKYSEIVDNYTKLKVENITLKNENEKNNWVQKYSELRIPAGRLSIQDEVEIIMSLPDDKRKMYFEKTTKSITAPSQKAAATDSIIPSGNSIKYADYEQVKNYYSEHKKEFGGMFRYSDVKVAMDKNNKK